MSTKIAFFHNLPGGGGIRMLQNIIERYRGKYQIDLYVIGESKPIEIKGIKTIYINKKPWKGFVLRNLWINFILPTIHKKVANKINKEYPFIFLTHDYFTKSPFLLRFLKINNVYLCQEPQREFYEPSIIHAPSIKDKLINIIRYPIKLIDEKNVSNARNIICNSIYSRKVIKKVYGKNSHIVYPGVDIESFRPTNEKKKNIILCIGGINRIKSQFSLVKILKPILDKYQLVLVGSGPKEYVNQILNMPGDKKVKIINKLNDLDLRNYYAKSKVTCINSYMEPFGLSSIESQACGTPVVAVDEGGVKESIIDGVTGYISRRDDSEFLRKVKLAIKKNCVMGKKARKNIVNNWSWDKTLIPLDKYFPK